MGMWEGHMSPMIPQACSWFVITSEWNLTFSLLSFWKYWLTITLGKQIVNILCLPIPSSECSKMFYDMIETHGPEAIREQNKTLL